MFHTYFELTPVLDKEDKSHCSCQETRIYTCLYQSHNNKKWLPPFWGRKTEQDFKTKKKKIFLHMCVSVWSPLSLYHPALLNRGQSEQDKKWEGM